MSSQIPPLVCHTPPPIDFDDADDDADADDYGSDDIPEDDGIGADGNSDGADCLDDDFGDFATVPPRLTPEPIPGVSVIEKEAEEVTRDPISAESKGIFVARVGNDSPPSLILSSNNFIEDDEVVSGTVEEEDYDFQPFGCPSQPPEPPPEDSVSLPSLQLDADTSKSEDEDHVPSHPNPSSGTRSGIETEVDLPVVAVPTTADRTTPVIQEGGRFDDNTENDFTDFTTASNERSSVVLEIPTANDVSFELDDYAQLESTPSADSNFVSQQSRTDFATFDADFSKFDSFQASFPATVDDPVVVKTPLEEAKSMVNVEQQTLAKSSSNQQPDDDFDDFQEFATFSEQPGVTTSQSTHFPSLQPTTSIKAESTTNSNSEVDEKNKIHNQDLSTVTDENFAENDDDDDDFGEFNDFKHSDVITPTAAPVPTFSLENVHSLLATMFPNVTPEPHASDTGQQAALEHIPINSLHSQLQDFDNTSALGYQYNKSTSSKALVTALGIDSRNIMYGPKWNSSMPRFAANLSFNPLEPLKPDTATSKDSGTIGNEKNTSSSTSAKGASLTSGLDPLQATGASGSSVPAVQFDWNSSGLVNPLEASHAHTLLLDLEQLEVMASLNDKINVDSSSYSPALRSTSHVANTVQLHSPTTTATTTSTTPLLLSPSSPRTSSPSPSPTPPPPPPLLLQPPILLLPSTSSPLLVTTTKTTTIINTQTNRPNHRDNNGQQTQMKTFNNRSVDATGTDGNRRAPLDCSIALLTFANNHDLLICTSTTTTTTTTTTTIATTATPIVEFTPRMDNMIIHTATPRITPPFGGARVPPGNTSCPLPSDIGRTDLQRIGFDLLVFDEMRPIVEPEPTATSASDRPQSFDDYLDLSVQEMLQKSSTGQPTDGSKGEVLDPEVPENAGPVAADDIAVMAAIPAHAAVSPTSHPDDEDDVRSLDFTANAAVATATAGSSSNVQYSATLPHANQELQSTPIGQMQPQPAQYPSPPQQQPMSISNSPNNVPVVRTIKLQETHIFTPSRGGTPVSRDITDRDIVVREYHDVEYSLEKAPNSTVVAGSSRKDPDLDDFNDFQSVPAPVASAPITPGVVPSFARPIIGQSPTEELEKCSPIASEGKKNGTEAADASGEDDDFTEFQTATVPTLTSTAATSFQPVNRSVSNVQNNRSNTSSPIMLLSPAILLPQQATAPTAGKDLQQPRSHQPASQINWPEPGIDPDELARFEAAFAKPAAAQKPPQPGAIAAEAKVPVSNQSVPKPKPIEEDEWTDFISSKPVNAGGSTIHRSPVATNVDKVAAPTTNVSAVQEEWTDFISSTPAPVSTQYTSQNHLSSSQNNFNYSRSPVAGASGAQTLSSWNQPQLAPPQFSSWNSNSLYYNPMASLPATGPRQPYGVPQNQQQQQQQFHGVPMHHNPQQQRSLHLHQAYQHHSSSAGGARVLAQQPMHLLPELSFITPNTGGHGTNATGAKPATHSFLSNVISSSSFTKK